MILEPMISDLKPTWTYDPAAGTEHAPVLQSAML